MRSLTARELKVLALLAEGKCPKEIAQMLDLATATVETHKSNIYRKMDFHSLVDVTHYALCRGLVENKYEKGVDLWV